MNCPNCGAWTYEDNAGRWFCSAQCGWNSGYAYTMGERDELSQLRRWRPAGQRRPVDVPQSVRVVRRRACAGAARGSLRP